MSQIYSSTKTTNPSATNYNRPWYIIDASKLPVGRLASKVATALTGKNLANYTPHVDMGGCVVVINSAKLVFTGKKMEKKNYFRYDNGRIGSLKVRSLSQQLAVDPKKPIYLAIKRMLPKNRHQDIWANQRLHIIPGDKHNFTQILTPLV